MRTISLPPGSDMAGEIRNGFKPAERMESELFSRLAVHSAGAWCWCGMVIFYHILAINNPVQGEGAGVSQEGASGSFLSGIPLKIPRCLLVATRDIRVRKSRFDALWRTT